MAAKSQRTPFPEYLRRPHQDSSRTQSLRWILILGSVSVLGYLLLLGDAGLLTLQRQRAEVAGLEASLERLERDQTFLREELEELHTPGSFRLERVAREKYGMVSPGQRVIHVVEPTAESTPSRLP